MGILLAMARDDRGASRRRAIARGPGGRKKHRDGNGAPEHERGVKQELRAAHGSRNEPVGQPPPGPRDDDAQDGESGSNLRPRHREEQGHGQDEPGRRVDDPARHGYLRAGIQDRQHAPTPWVSTTWKPLPSTPTTPIVGWDSYPAGPPNQKAISDPSGDQASV